MKFAGDFPPFLPCDVRVTDEFIFQHHGLVAGVGLSFFSLSRLFCRVEKFSRIDWKVEMKNNVKDLFFLLF